jgi:ankyrin repeat protein
MAGSRFHALLERDPIEALARVRAALWGRNASDAIPDAAAVAAQVLTADSEIRNGGHRQLIDNHGRTATQAMAAAFAAIGATRAAIGLDDAIARHRNEDDGPRAGLDDLDEAYYQHDPPVPALLADFLAAADPRWFERIVEAGADAAIDDARALRAAIELGSPARVGRALAGGTIAGDEPPLHYAARHLKAASGAAIVAQLVAAGATVDARDAHGSTALMIAADFANLTMVHALLEAGADPNATSARGTPLHWASGGACTRRLLAAGAAVDARNGRGRTPLHSGATLERIAALLEAGADARALDEHGAGVLHHDVQAEAMALLLAAGADPGRSADDGTTPLMHQSSGPSAELLIAAGARVDVVDRLGRSALHHQASSSVVTVLLAHGGDPLAVDLHGRTPIDDARERDYFGGRVVRILEAAARRTEPIELVSLDAAVSPIEQRAARILDALEDAGLIELADDDARPRLIDDVADLLAAVESGADPAAALAELLTSHDAVADLFADDAALRMALEVGPPPELRR